MFTHSYFKEISDKLFNELSEKEDLNINYSGENTNFTRFNHSKIRQSTVVHQNNVTLSLQNQSKASSVTLSCAGDPENDWRIVKEGLTFCRREIESLPDNPFLTEVENHGSSLEEKKAVLPSGRFIDYLGPFEGCDAVGIIACGDSGRGQSNNKGTNHWYTNESFYVDYSLYTPEKKAVKGCYSGTHWDQSKFVHMIEESKAKTPILKKMQKKITPGKYRTYLSPSATAELLGLLNWGGWSYSNLKKGNSPLRKLYEKSMQLSEKVNLIEDFSLGLIQRFNSFGELAPEKLDLISNGELRNLLISTKTAKEHELESNFANNGESPRSIVMAPGTLSEEDILKELDTGLYISNLWYVNWSDRDNARITGMTRYACFWVENGEIISPIENLRFDETLYHALGAGLIDLTNFQEVIPELSSYGRKAIGGSSFPGLLIDNFTFTL